jgi:hypothetical protein
MYIHIYIVHTNWNDDAAAVARGLSYFKPKNGANYEMGRGRWFLHRTLQGTGGGGVGWEFLNRTPLTTHDKKTR